MEPTQFTLRTWVKLLKAAVLALQQLLELIENLTFPDDEDDIDPAQNLVHFTEITARGSVERKQLDHFADELAEALHTAAASMPSADCPDCQAARERCRQVITNLLGPHADQWRTFSDKLDEALDLLTDKGKLNEINDYRHAYCDIAEGILQA